MIRATAKAAAKHGLERNLESDEVGGNAARAILVARGTSADSMSAAAGAAGLLIVARGGTSVSAADAAARAVRIAGGDEADVILNWKSVEHWAAKMDPSLTTSSVNSSLL